MATIAVSTCAFADLSLPTALERIAGLAGAVEVRCKGKHGIDTVSQNRAVAASGLRTSVHAPEGIAIWSADEGRRKAAIVAHRRLIEACVAAGAELYVVHPDYSERPIVQRGETRAALRKSFTALRELGDACQMRVAVENMPGLRSSHFVSPDVDFCGLGLALDVGHAQISGTLDAFLQEEIAHLHLHDNRGYGDADRHLPVGHGLLTPLLVGRIRGSCAGLCVLEHANEAQVRESLAFLDELEPKRNAA